jgi:hypothetical protein
MKSVIEAKIIVSVMIMTLLFAVCSDAVFATNSTANLANKHLVLGSTAYIAKIQTIAAKSGYKSALSEIMKDVDKNGTDIDKNDPATNLRFRKLVSTVISKIGSVDMQTHYFRNKLNRSPESLDKLIALNKTLPLNKRWILLAIINSAYHVQGTDGEYNLKFVSFDGFCEAVYNKKGVLLNEKNDPINMGTYNYAAGISGVDAHQKYDVAPYLIWGNTLDSPQKGRTDILKGANTAMMNCKAHATEVFLYRKNLFGMQQGKVI